MKIHFKAVSMWADFGSQNFLNNKSHIVYLFQEQHILQFFADEHHYIKMKTHFVAYMLQRQGPIIR